MAEDNANTAPTTESAAPATSSPTTDRASARDAAIAALGDMAEPVAEETGEPAAEGEQPPAEAKTDDKPAEPPKEQLSPQLRAIAAQEKHNRELAEAAKADKAAASAERQAIAAERAELEALRAKAVEASDVSKYRTDLVAFADDLKLSPEERKQLATDLFYSTQPEDKRPATYRKQGGVLSEVEQLKRNYESLAKKLQEKEEAETKAQQEAREAVETAQTADAIMAEGGSSAVVVKAFLEHAPDKAKKDLVTLAKQMMQKADDPASITSEKVVAEYERILTEQTAWLRKALQATAAAKDGTNAPPKGLPAAKSLTNQGTASPTRGQGPMTAEARRAAAIAALED